MDCLHINASPGDPNTFWQGESGRWYRTKDEATEDNESKSVEPEDYRIEKTFYNRHHSVILGLTAIILAAAAIWAIYRLNLDN